MSGILQTIREQLSSLPPKEQEIALYILEHPDRVAQMGIKELSAATLASTATISRFCRSLNLGGFPDFKLRIASDSANKATPDTYQDIVAGNSLSRIVSAIETNHIRSISDTTRLLDYRMLEAALTALQQARRIDLYGMATSGIVATDFAQKLTRIGKFAQSLTDSHLQITAASTLQSQDLAIAVSYSGETPEIIDALSCAKENGATTISLTRYGTNTLASVADITLFTSSLESGMRRGDMASRIAQLHMVDILFTALVSEQFHEYVPRLEQSYQRVTQYRRKRGRSE